MAKQEQPARKSYFFGKGYVDLANTIKGAFYLNWECVKERFELMKTSSASGKLFHTTVMLCLLVFGTLWTLWLSTLHIAILGISFLFVYLAFSIVWLADRIYLKVQHISTACPNPDCQSRYHLPAYVCSNPACMLVHTDLTPGKWGILHRECLCGTKLPTTFLNGRERLTAICPHCWEDLKDEAGEPVVTLIAEGGRSVQISIPIIGNKSVGKTCYINYAVTSLREEIALSRGWAFAFEDETDQARYARAMSNLDAGRRPDATFDHRLTAYKFFLRSDAWPIPKQIYIYDVAGEIFSSAFEVGSQQTYGFSDGFLILLDPFSLEGFAAESDPQDVADSHAFDRDINDMMDALLINLEKIYRLKQKGTVKTHVAVVLNKCDMANLEGILGEPAVAAYRSAHPECSSQLEAQNAICQAFLIRYGAANFVNTMRTKFKSVQYFSCSALGHAPNGAPFTQTRIADPILWLLNKADSVLS